MRQGIRHLGDFTTSPRVLLIAAIALIVGTGGMVAGVILLKLIRLCHQPRIFRRLQPGTHAIQPIAARAQCRSGPGRWRVDHRSHGTLRQREIRGHGIPEAIEAILLGRSRLDLKVAILKPLSSAISIGTGGPFGAEGPIIMTGGAIGSLIAQLLPVSDAERKTLLVAGAAAGMTTVFGTPIAAVMLAVELLLFEWTPRSFIPVAVAAIIAELERDMVRHAVAAVSLSRQHGHLVAAARLLGARRAAIGVAVGCSDAARLRLRGRVPEATDPLDVVARARAASWSASAV